MLAIAQQAAPLLTTTGPVPVQLPTPPVLHGGSGSNSGGGCPTCDLAGGVKDALPSITETIVDAACRAGAVDICVVGTGIELLEAGDFLTLDCAGAALDGGGTLALYAGGPFGVPIAAAAYSASVGIDAYQGDYGGVLTGSGAWFAGPFQFGTGAMKTFSARAGGVGAAYSVITCVQGAY